MPHVEQIDPNIDGALNRMDRIEKRLAKLHQNAAPTVPQYDLQQTIVLNYFAMTVQFKSYPLWWNTSDQRVSPTTPEWFNSWSAKDSPSDLAVVSGSGYTPVYGDFNGFWTPGSPGPGYVGSRPVPVGVVGNYFTNEFTNNFSYGVSSGTTLQWIGAHQDRPGDSDLWSDPYILVRAKIVDQFDHSIIHHDFGEFGLVTKDNDVTTIVDANGGNSYVITYPLGSVWTGPSWVVP